MSFDKPFHRNYRPVIEGHNSGYSNWAYIVDHSYSANPEYYTRAFSIIQEDMTKLFEYVEPSDVNTATYSFRIHELLIRICIEVEANFKAILRENIFDPKDKDGKPRNEKNWNINDFKIVNKTHHLDDYSIQLPFWKGEFNVRKPFEAWKKNNHSLSWYQAYNQSKHDRVHNFEKANFANLIDAYSGLCVILSSQFRTEDFKPGSKSLGANTDSYFGGGFGFGNLIVDWPDDWKDEEKYEFDWSKLKTETERFAKIDYNNLL